MTEWTPPRLVLLYSPWYVHLLLLSPVFFINFFIPSPKRFLLLSVVRCIGSSSLLGFVLIMVFCFFGSVVVVVVFVFDGSVCQFDDFYFLILF